MCSSLWNCQYFLYTHTPFLRGFTLFWVSCFLWPKFWFEVPQKIAHECMYLQHKYYIFRTMDSRPWTTILHWWLVPFWPRVRPFWCFRLPSRGTTTSTSKTTTSQLNGFRRLSTKSAFGRGCFQYWPASSPIFWLK